MRPFPAPARSGACDRYPGAVAAVERSAVGRAYRARGHCRRSHNNRNKDGEVSIILADDSAVRALNRQWRGVDKPTNVLSFPAKGIDGRPRLFGDIVMAYETLKRECDDEGRVFLHHLAHLTIHGFLHLMGYDHSVDAEAEEMEGLESKIMMRMSLPDPWLGREFSDA